MSEMQSEAVCICTQPGMCERHKVPVSEHFLGLCQSGFMTETDWEARREAHEGVSVETDMGKVKPPRKGRYGDIKKVTVKPKEKIAAPRAVACSYLEPDENYGVAPCFCPKNRTKETAIVGCNVFGKCTQKHNYVGLPYCGSCKHYNTVNQSEEDRYGAAIENRSEMAAFFDKVWIISLEERKWRVDEVRAQMRKVGWPFVEPMWFQAVEGRRFGGRPKHPSWWAASGPAWGCYMSHLTIIRDAIERGYERILVLEDDAVLVEDFRERVWEFLSQLPWFWDLFYLGGQHRPNVGAVRVPVRPISISSDNRVQSPWDVHRTHAMAYNRKFLQEAEKFLCTESYKKRLQARAINRGQHIDHHMGYLCRSRKYKVYSVYPWLIGQRAGRSDISAKTFPSDRIQQTDWASVRPVGRRRASVRTRTRTRRMMRAYKKRRR